MSSIVQRIESVEGRNVNTVSIVEQRFVKLEKRLAYLESEISTFRVSLSDLRHKELIRQREVALEKVKTQFQNESVQKAIRPQCLPTSILPLVTDSTSDTPTVQYDPVTRQILCLDGSDIGFDEVDEGNTAIQM